LYELNIQLKALLTPKIIAEIVNLIPDEWLQGDYFSSPDEYRNAYNLFLNSRIANADIFVKAADDARL
jgi:hypothetical protein